MVWCLVGLVLFLIYAAYRADLARSIGGRWVVKLTAFFRPLLNLLDIGKQYSAKQLGLGASPGNEFGQLLLIVIFALFVLILGSKPNEVARWLPGAYSVSLMLGGWLPILTYLSAIGRRLRAPLIVATFTAIALITGLVGDNHDVRLLPDANTPRPLALDDAVHIWMAANHCSPDNAKACPRPVIVAASGGASRAGFFTASVLGELLDKASDHGLDATGLRNRLFAISSVSGSSVGAVMTVAALAAGGPETHFPCGNKKFSDWYGDDIENWRGCLESLMSGDFLTPTFIGLTFHDMIPFGPWPDRASILEELWEDTFAAGIDKLAKQAKKPTCSDAPYQLDCPFFGLKPTQELWLPLLILNGVSVSTGQRIVTTLLDSQYAASGDCPTGDKPADCTLFTETWFFHKFLEDRSQSGQWLERLQRTMTMDYLLGRTNNDIRLSTAAHNSARFPIVSPPGNIRNREHFVVDRIVDGGYMENFGVLTAFELAQAVHAVNAGADAVRTGHLQRSRRTGDRRPRDRQAGAQSLARQGRRDRLLDRRDQPLRRGQQYARRARQPRRGATRRPVAQPHAVRLQGGLRACPRLAGAHRPARQRLQPANFTKTPRAVSMSWWLSTPVQYRLFDEIDGAANLQCHPLGRGLEGAADDVRLRGEVTLIKIRKSPADPA